MGKERASLLLLEVGAVASACVAYQPPQASKHVFREMEAGLGVTFFRVHDGIVNRC
jgi:hypothetical protein